jgi:hypothetical protein
MKLLFTKIEELALQKWRFRRDLTQYI